MSDRIEIYPGSDGAWRWRMVAGNNRIIASSGESFEDKNNAAEAAERANPGVPLSVVDPEQES